MFRHIAHTATSLTLAAIGSIFLSAGFNPAQAQENARYVAVIPFAFGIHDGVFRVPRPGNSSLGACYRSQIGDLDGY